MMKQKSAVTALPLAMTVAAGLIVVPAYAAKPSVERGKAAMKAAAFAAASDVRAFASDGSRLNAPLEGGIAGAPIQNDTFEPPLYALGPITGQNGWLAFTGGPACAATPNTNTPAIANTGPAMSGAQWINIPDGPCTDGSFNGPFGPSFAPQPAGPYTVRAKIRIPNTGGADYDIIPQAPSQAFLTARVKFFYGDFDPDGAGPLTGDGIAGDILVLNDPDAGGPLPLAFEDTGADYTPGALHDLRIEVDPAPGPNTIRYFLDGTLRFTGNIVAGTAVEQVVIPSDNFHLPGEIGQIDDVAFEPGFAGPACAANLVTTGASATQVDIDDLLFLLAAWGPCPASCPANIVTTGSSATQVDIDDLLFLLGEWGPC